MSRRTDVATGVALALLLLGAPGCARPKPAQADAQVGRHHVRCTPPRGWEHLDHGRQHLFRSGERQLSLTDRGPTSPDSALVFADVLPGPLQDYVLGLAPGAERREIATRTPRAIHGSNWVEVETWDRVSHLNRSRVAFLVHEGSLLVLAIDRGPYDEVAPAFESLLASLELAHGVPLTR